MRSDFTEIYTYARRKGLLVILFTNGTLITQEIAELLGKFDLSAWISPYMAHHNQFMKRLHVSQVRLRDVFKA